ncbi:MAG: SBBP repeat-containing protein, partial [Bacteroidota bacterium]
SDDALVLKYNSSGLIQWNKTFVGVGDNSDNVNALTVDAQGNSYVAGYTYSNNMRDMCVIKINSAGDTVWTRKFNGSSNAMDEATDIKVDATGNVYVTGFTKESLGDYDVTTMKFSPSGVLLWNSQFNNSSVNGEDKGNKLLVDGSGNVYVAAYSDMDPSISTNKDILLIKYNSAGVQQWIKQYSGPGNDEPKDLLFSGSNVVILGNTEYASDIDMVTISYNSAGTQQWIKTYSSTSGNDDVIYDATSDNAGNVFITGKSDNGVNSDAVTISYSSTGNQNWVHSYGNTTNREKGETITLGTNGEIVVAGLNNNGIQNDIFALSISTNGSTQWQINYDGGSSLDDNPSVILTDLNGDYILTGKTDFAGTNSNHSNFLMLKYSAIGNLLWTSTFDNNIEGNDGIVSTAIDNANSIIVSGFSQSTLGQKDLVTAKYSNPGTGASLKENEGINQKLVVYPNPISENSIITGISEIPGEKVLTIYQMDGKCLFSQAIEDKGTIKKGNLSKGTYLFSVIGDSILLNGKFIVE